MKERKEFLKRAKSFRVIAKLFDYKGEMLSSIHQALTMMIETARSSKNS
jgi:hypothetical protein